MVKTTCGTEILVLISIIVFCNFLSCTNCNKLNRTRQRRLIINGHVAERSKFPYQVLIQNHGAKSMKPDWEYWGGVIINENHVLTIDRGFRELPVASLSVIVGNINLDDRSVVKKVLQIDFPPYNQPYRHNLALIKINGTFEPWTTLIKPIKLETKKTKRNRTDPIKLRTISSDCVVSGFGRTSEKGEMSSKLKFLRVSIMPWETCKEKVNTHFGTELQDNIICSNDGYCTFDDGGPLVCSGLLTGIMAWREVPCGKLTAFVEVAKYVQWIKDHQGLCARVRAASASTSHASFPAQSSPFLNLIALLIILFIGKIFRNL